MIQFFRNIPVRYKLLTSFGLIIAINALFGFFSITIMRQIGELVNVTYDKALMSGTFAQAAKFNFAVFDAQTRAGLVANDQDEFQVSKARSKKAFETLKEDLQVVAERALGEKSRELIKELSPSLERLYAKHLELIKVNKPTYQTGDQKHQEKLIARWSDAVKESNLYRKLTALYDDAAELGYKFRLESEEKNRLIIYQALIILGACILISLILSFFVAYLLIIPIFRLTRVCNDVAIGNYSVRATVDAQDEIGKLAASFNKMLSTIQEKDENIAALLASLPFGLFYIDKSGTISRERSPATDQIFKDFHTFNRLHDFFRLYRLNETTIDDILNTAFAKILPFKSAVFLFPSELKINDKDEQRIIELSYRAHYAAKKKLERIIVIAEDVTAKRKAIAENRILAERVDRISKIAADLPGYQDFLSASRKLFESIQSNMLHNENNAALARDLHSLKGLLSVYAYTSCAAEIHEIESNLALTPSPTSDDLSKTIKSVIHLFESQTKDITELLIINTDQSLVFFEPQKINQLEELIRLEGNSKLITLFEGLNRLPIKKAFARYLRHVQDYVTKSKTKDIMLSFLPSDEISPHESKKLDMVLLHLLNNSIDHGIEPINDRINKGKKSAGEISLSFKRQQDKIELKISDDGSGINLERLVAKAIERKLISEQEAINLSQNEKIKLIFAKGLSTQENVSNISGRGVGMDAVKEYIESLSGTIHIETAQNNGTSFIITIPSNAISKEFT